MKKLLIVDDEPEILAIIEAFLNAKGGFRIIKASNGQEALDILSRDNSIDLVVLDHRMPVLDGSATFAEIRKNGLTIPVILLTGSVGRQTKKLKVDAYLFKPIDLTELLAHINRLLKL